MSAGEERAPSSLAFVVVVVVVVAFLGAPHGRDAAGGAFAESCREHVCVCFFLF